MQGRKAALWSNVRCAKKLEYWTAACCQQVTTRFCKKAEDRQYCQADKDTVQRHGKQQKFQAKMIEAKMACCGREPLLATVLGA